MKLALIRHAPTDWNEVRRLQGRVDRPLSPGGRKRAQMHRVPVAFDRFRWYCSPLGRARETADLLGIPDYRTDAALIEMDWGDWEGQVFKQLRRELGDSVRANEARGRDFRPPGGESPREVQARLSAWLASIAPSGADVGAVAHQGTVRCVYALARGWDMRGESPVEFDWNAIHLFEFDAEGRLLDSYRSIPLERKP
ncbi:MAG: histidine phosphatase family protein [Gammaproteobacteria bacterium]|nr:histidine phosphatase family protein [Gammaproteobacteria bacterium]